MPNPVFLRSSILATLLFVLATSVGAQEEVQTIEFHSPAVERTMKYNIVLPASYDSSQERYPVLHLLHGLTSNYIAWSRMGAAFYAGLVDDLIVVMPGGHNGAYWVQSLGHIVSIQYEVIRRALGERPASRR